MSEVPGRLSVVLCHAAVSSINWYQRVLSPRKGFACAFRVRYGGQSCSQFAKSAFDRGSFWLASRAVVGRLNLCSDAAATIRIEQALSLPSGVYDEDLDALPGEQKPERPKDCEQEACACAAQTAGPPIAMGAANCCVEGLVRAIAGL
jgi:putative component of membrane protein insertase Oxa1/YidC/SpoIIIJ protein YidD